jgi:hypothetical protein
MGDGVSLCLLKQQREPKDDHDWAAYEHFTTIDVPDALLEPLGKLAGRSLSDPGGSDTTRWIAQVCVPLAWSGLIVSNALKELPVRIALGDDVRRHVAVFFGEGDDFFLGTISPDGFTHAGPPRVSGPPVT